MDKQEFLDQLEGTEIAVIGMVARLPGAKNIEQYWQNLRDGVESISFYSDEELKEAGVSPKMLNHPHYVKAGAPLDDIEMFDASFFGFSPKDAAIMDPQHRHFLQCAWQALEHAGYDPERFDGLIGIYGGSGFNAYLPYNLLTNPELVDTIGFFLLRHTGNDKDFLTTRVSYLLNLKGPSMNIQTACSTSLVAIHTACQSLLGMECDMALAGGVTIELPHRQGYFYREGEILSPDGHCRAFDASSQGTIFGSGVGIVVLRRLRDAIEAGDTIHAIIKGSAINNDGHGKVNYLAPSVEGQATAIRDAIGIANVETESISYIEAHGTGTRIGDPIEINALTEAFRYDTDQKGFCAIGSVKTNIGHLDTAAGVAAFIKTVLALKHKQIPPSLNFKEPNPMIDFENSPFYVQTKLTEWQTNGYPRRAGVSALGVGGTNAHIILEEAPNLRRGDGAREQQSESAERSWQLLTLSAKSPSALEVMSRNLGHAMRLGHAMGGEAEQGFIEERVENIELADVAYTLQMGRQAFPYRRILVCQDCQDASTALEQLDSKRLLSQKANDPAPSVIFMFAGGGAQYPNMGRELYEQEPIYRQALDECFSLLRSYLKVDLKALIFPPEEQVEWATEQLLRPSLTLPALFMTEYALARLWMSWGIQPTAMIGHSMGEYTAACLAGVLSLPDALELVTLRGQLFETLPEGAMLSVSLSEADLQPLLVQDLSIAVLNTPEMSVVSGKVEAIKEMEDVLSQKEIDYRHIKITVAAHSPMLEPILEPFARRLSTIQFNAPTIPYISNVTGTWSQPEVIMEANYWVRHLRHTVRFDDGLRELYKDDPNRIFLEVGPGKTLTSLAQMHPHKVPTQQFYNSLPHTSPELPFMLTTLGKLWLAGVNVDWATFYENSKQERHRIPLPTYPFERQRYWIEPGNTLLSSGEGSAVREPTDTLRKMSNINDWFYQPRWQKAARSSSSSQNNPLRWLIFTDGFGLGEQIATRLRKAGHHVITVNGAGNELFRKLNDHSVAINRRAHLDYEYLIEDLIEHKMLPQRIVHLWAVNENPTSLSKLDSYYKNQEIGFNSLLSLAQILGSYELEEPIHITVFTNGLQQIGDEAITFPEKATILGPCKVIPKEYPHISCQAIDIIVPEARRASGERASGQRGSGERAKWQWLSPLLSRAKADGRGEKEPLVDQILTELMAEPSNSIIALRDGERWEQQLTRMELNTDTAQIPFGRLREEGVYLITGGLGGIGLVIAEALAKQIKPKLVLISRSGLPEPHNAPASALVRLQKVHQLEQLGASVHVMSADVSHEEQMKEVIKQIIQRFGTIHGVIHAAGVLNDGLIQFKTANEIEQVLAPKIRGALILDQLLTDNQITLDFFILFSSTSTLLAPAGQVDYVAANAFLNAFAQQRQAKRGEYTVSINWGAWQKVGMAAQAAIEHGFLERQSTQLTIREVAHPLLDKCLLESPEQILYSSQYSINKHWILDQHRLKGGQALIPGTGYLELAQAALSQQQHQMPIEIEDLFFVAPLEVKPDESKEVRVLLQKNETGYHFAVSSSPLGANTEAEPFERLDWQEHARAKVSQVKGASATNYSIEELLSRCDQPATSFINEIGQEQHLTFGPRWQNMRQIHLGKGEALALLELPSEFIGDLYPAGPPFGAEGQSYSLHPALMDMATGYGLPLIENYDATQDFYVPLSYKRVRIYNPLPAKIYSYIRYKRSTGRRSEGNSNNEFATFDVTIMDETGKTLVEIDEFMLKRVGATLAVAPPVINVGATRSVAPPVGQPANPNIILELALTEGILPEEGVKAFERILSALMPAQIIVSSLDLNALLKEVDRDISAAKDSPSSFSLSRPKLQSDYEAPRNEIEKSLAKCWQELLGIEQIGIHDNFFELGGHSLIAVRLFTKLKKKYPIDLSLATLFEVPTIAQFAELVQEELGIEQDQTKATGQSLTSRRRDRSSSLVAIQPHGSKPPFFCVHGIHGNVLNFYHLSRYLGPDQPFYGLQAQGVDGKKPALKSITEMATLYIKEMRTIQPEGPYYLGGFSFGGEVAFEIAQQLHTQGEEVALLALLDTVDPGHARQEGSYIVGERSDAPAATRQQQEGDNGPGASEQDTSGERARGQGSKGLASSRLGRFLRRSKQEKWHSLTRWTDSQIKSSKYKLAQLYRRRGRTLPQQLIEAYLEGTHAEALLAYHPKPYPGRLTLFRADATLNFQAKDPAMRWEKLADEIVLHMLYGPHEIVTEPHVQNLAKKLKECL